jgi:hypothetical protein
MQLKTGVDSPVLPGSIARMNALLERVLFNSFMYAAHESYYHLLDTSVDVREHPLATSRK